MPCRRPDALLVATALAAAVFAALALVRWSVWSYGSDLGTFVQLVLDTPGGFRDGVESGTHLRFHWSPGLALLWPALALVRHPLVLQAVQIAAVVAVAPLLAALVRPAAGPRLATLVGLGALLYPPLTAIAFNEFHELGLWPPVAVGLLLAADRGRWLAYALLLAVGVTLREDVCLLVAALGAALVIVAVRAQPPRPGFAAPQGLLAGVVADRRALALAGLAAIALGLGTAAVYFLLVVGGLGGWVPSHFYAYPFAQGPLPLLGALVTHPAALLADWGADGVRGRATYLLEALAPLAFLPLFTRWGLLCVPGLAICLLSRESITWRMGDHYASLWSPFALVAAAAVLTRRPRPRLAAAVVALGALVLAVANPMHPGHFLRPPYRDLAAARAALACVPAGAPLATHDEWFTEESARRPNATIATLDAPYGVWADDFDNPTFRAVVRPALRRAVARGELRPLCRVRAVAAYRRVR